MPMAKKKQGMSFEMMMQNMEINPRQLYRRSSWKKTRTTYDYVFMMCEEELNEIMPFDKKYKMKPLLCRDQNGVITLGWLPTQEDIFANDWVEQRWDFNSKRKR